MAISRMSSTDRSQTERIRRLRSKIQAVRRAECKTCPEEGPQGPTDQSTRVSRSLGQQTYYRTNAVGAVTQESCCSAVAPTPVPSYCGICPSGSTEIEIDLGALPITPDPTACYYFTNQSSASCVTFTSGITVYLTNEASVSRYPPAGYSLTGVTSYVTPCPKPNKGTNIDITDCNQTGTLIDEAIVFINTLTTDVIISITSSIGCSSVYMKISGNTVVQDASGCTYTTACLPLPTPLQCSLENFTLNQPLTCNSTPVLSADIYQFTNIDTQSIPVSITASNITFSVSLAVGATYPPSPYGISNITSVVADCSGSCAIPLFPIPITTLPSSGTILQGYIQNLSGQDIVVSLSNGTDCCPVFLADGTFLCGIVNASLYYAVAV